MLYICAYGVKFMSDGATVRAPGQIKRPCVMRQRGVELFTAPHNPICRVCWFEGGLEHIFFSFFFFGELGIFFLALSILRQGIYLFHKKGILSKKPICLSTGT